MALPPNSLIVLDVLLSTQSVSEAARQLGLTQSAVSHTLRGSGNITEMRSSSGSADRMTADPLGGKLAATPGRGASPAPRCRGRAPELRSGEYRADLCGRHAAIFTSISSFPALPARLPPMRPREAPKASLKIVPWDTNAIETQLGTGIADVGIGVDPPGSAQIRHRKLFDERLVCVAAKGVFERPLTVGDYAGLDHVVVMRTDAVSSPIDKLLAERDLVRRVVLRVPYFSAALGIVAQSRLVVTAPERLALRAAPQLGLEISPLPFEAPKFAVHLVWHERFGHDPLNIWLRGQHPCLSDAPSPPIDVVTLESPFKNCQAARVS